MKWHIQSKTIPTSLDELKSLLLKNRNISDEETFFKGKSPFKITLKELGISQKEIDKIKHRLEEAKKSKQKIIIFGDYDADGISASAVLWQALYAEKYNVLPFIPKRLKHGYGLSIKALKDIFEEHPDLALIITVDNGIVAHEALHFLKEKGVDVVVSDHHQKDDKEVEALAVFHSSKVSGCATAWFLARELTKNKKLLTNLLALVAISTVTDLMPLTDVNRSLLMYGLVVLQSNGNLGLKKLFSKAKIDPEKIDTYTIGFQIGPRINAMGRLADGMDALRLLCTTDNKKASELSELLQNTNEDRQTLTMDLTKQAEELIEQEQDEKIIILNSDDYHEGIIGLIAGRMTEKFSKPSIVISTGSEVAKASARSLPGFNITEFIRLFRDDLLEMGGHPLAAGFALENDKVAKVKKAMQIKAKEMLKDVDLVKTLEAEAVLPNKLLMTKTVKLIEDFAPFGLANPKPSFVIEDVLIKNYRLLGREQEHFKLIVEIEQEEYDVLAWRRADLSERLKIGDKLDLLVNLDINSFRGVNKVQMILRDFHQKTAAV